MTFIPLTLTHTHTEKLLPVTWQWHRALYFLLSCWIKYLFLKTCLLLRRELKVFLLSPFPDPSMRRTEGKSLVLSEGNITAALLFFTPSVCCFPLLTCASPCSLRLHPFTVLPSVLLWLPLCSCTCAIPASSSETPRSSPASPRRRTSGWLS